MKPFSKKKVRKIIVLYASISILLVSILVVSALYLFNKDSEQAGLDPTLTKENEQTGNPVTLEAATPTPEPTPTPIPYYDATWVGVGDIMSHTPQLPGYYDKATDTYNFDSVFAEIKDYLAGDWVMANLETPIAGKEYKNTGYPMFNAPLELADALKTAGFAIFSTANNHSLDKGEKGLMNTLNHLDARGLETVGTYRTQEERDTSVIVAHNNIKMGFLSYTYGTNGIPIPEGKDYLVNLIDKDIVINDINKLKADGAEVITIALHFGNEYQTQPTDAQKTLARDLIAAGAHIIAGSHPHVLQPYEIFDVVEEDGTTRQGVIIYSMGNFISNQREETKDYGAVFKVNLRKQTATGSIDILDVEVTPTWVHRYKPDSYNRYRILPAQATLDALDDELLKAADYAQLNKNLEILTTRLNTLNAEKQ